MAAQSLLFQNYQQCFIDDSRCVTTLHIMRKPLAFPSFSGIVLGIWSGLRV